MSSRATASGEVVLLRADDPLFWLERGQQLLLGEQLDEACRCFDHALDAAPGDLLALNAKARAHLQLGEVEPALALLEEACERYEASAELWNNRGVALARHGQSEEALQAFAHALSLDPSDGSILCNRAMTHVGLGRHDEALRDLGQAVQRDPRCVTTWTAKGATHLRVGQIRMARHAFLQVARLSWQRGGSLRYGVASMVMATALAAVARFGARAP
jgi:Flp pilus assembly protein TadD